MPDPTFTTPPDAPSRAVPSTFSSLTDAFLAWMVTFKGELTTAVTWFSSTASTVSTDAGTATTQAGIATTQAGNAATSAGEASASAGASAQSVIDAANAGAAAAGASVWISAASYTLYDAVISPVDDLTYRAITTHTGVTTDPSADATNWLLLNADILNFATLDGTETLTNKTLILTNNTLSGTLAQFNTALSDGFFATLTGTETLTNKTLTAPALTGTPTAPTAAGGTNTTQIATTAFVLANGAGGYIGNITYQNANPPTPAATTWNIRPFNTVAEDANSLLTLSSNEFSCSTNSVIQWEVLALETQYHQTRIVRVSDSAVIVLGTHGWSQDTQNNTGTSSGLCSLVAGETYRMEHYTDVSGSRGFGRTLIDIGSYHMGYITFFGR